MKHLVGSGFEAAGIEDEERDKVMLGARYLGPCPRRRPQGGLLVKVSMIYEVDLPVAKPKLHKISLICDNLHNLFIL